MSATFFSVFKDKKIWWTEIDTWWWTKFGFLPPDIKKHNNIPNHNFETAYLDNLKPKKNSSVVRIWFWREFFSRLFFNNIL